MALRIKRARRPAVGVFAGCLLLAVFLVLGPIASARNPAAKWVKSIPKRHRANVVLIAGLTKAAAGFNFNGYSNGKLKITVPRGWRVHVLLKDKDPIPHSAMVVKWSTKPSAPKPKPAFRGAQSKGPYKGTTKGHKSAFTFRASKAGRYRIICAVPGHVEAGMWSVLIVKKGAKKASARA